MNQRSSSATDRMMAQVCAACPVCRQARANQEGLANRFVRNIEGGLCPFCRAYERINGRKAHEPLP